MTFKICLIMGNRETSGALGINTLHNSDWQLELLLPPSSLCYVFYVFCVQPWALFCMDFFVCSSLSQLLIAYCLAFRFEMPFNIWCGGCNSMIAKGVRFNAEKKQVGNYYSTKVSFVMLLTVCCRIGRTINTLRIIFNDVFYLEDECNEHRQSLSDIFCQYPLNERVYCNCNLVSLPSLVIVKVQDIVNFNFSQFWCFLHSIFN